MASRPLTERQQEILDFIKHAIHEQGFPPTLREIGKAFGIRSTKGVNDHLAALERKGKIRRHAELSRGIEVVGLAPAGADPLDRSHRGRLACFGDRER